MDSLRPPHRLSSNVQPIDVEAWTDDTTVVLGHLTLDSTTPVGNVHGTADANTIVTFPLDNDGPRPSINRVHHTRDAEPAPLVQPLRRKRSNRDSMRTRNALLKGKEGSRRRQKWENGEPHPTSRVLQC